MEFAIPCETGKLLKEWADNSYQTKNGGAVGQT
jgi:hypothetical protein